MPQRNGQNPTRAVKFGQAASRHADSGKQLQSKSPSGNAICAGCGAEVPPKPGFRPSSLTCPKCGRPLTKK